MMSKLSKVHVKIVCLYKTSILWSRIYFLCDEWLCEKQFKNKSYLISVSHLCISPPPLYLSRWHDPLWALDFSYPPPHRWNGYQPITILFQLWRIETFFLCLCFQKYATATTSKFPFIMRSLSIIQASTSALMI